MCPEPCPSRWAGSGAPCWSQSRGRPSAAETRPRSLHIDRGWPGDSPWVAAVPVPVLLWSWGPWARLMCAKHSPDYNCQRSPATLSSSRGFPVWNWDATSCRWAAGCFWPDARAKLCPAPAKRQCSPCAHDSTLEGGSSGVNGGVHLVIWGGVVLEHDRPLLVLLRATYSYKLNYSNPCWCSKLNFIVRIM